MSQTKAQVSKLLTMVSNQYSITSAIGNDVLPMLPVKQSTGIIGGYGMGHLRTENDLMGGRGEARRVDLVEYDLTKGYMIQDHGLEEVVTENDYDNVEEPFDAEVDKTEALTSVVLINKEIFAKNALMNPATITNGLTLAGSDKFSDKVNSDPLGVIELAQQTTLAASGVAANAAIMSKKTFMSLQYHPQILDTLGFKFDRPGKITKEEMQRALGLEYLFIGDMAYNSAKQGQPGVLTQVWGAEMLVYYRPSAAAKKQVSLGYYLRKMAYKERGVYKYPLNNPPGAHGIIVRDQYDYRIVNPAAGFLVQGTY